MIVHHVRIPWEYSEWIHKNLANNSEYGQVVKIENIDAGSEIHVDVAWVLVGDLLPITVLLDADGIPYENVRP